MFFIPGFLISILTFPGVIVHEFAHMFFCKIRKVAVLDACYFRVGNPAGYIIHENTDNFYTTFWISMGPFFVNTLLCFLVCFPAFMPINFFSISSPLSYFLMWIGISIGMHAIPSNQDAKNLFDQAKEKIKDKNLLAIITFPLVAMIYVFNFLRIVWIDLFYALAIGIWFPQALFKL